MSATRGFGPPQGDVSARKTYDMMDEPAGVDYQALLNAAISHCDTAILSVDETKELNPSGTQVLARLQGLLKSEVRAGKTRLLRLRFDRTTLPDFVEAARLFAWQQPDRPENLSLLRQDGTPWLVSIAAERLGYLELAPFEKLLLGRQAPGLAAVLAHHVARDAILARMERTYEANLEKLIGELVNYGRSVLDEGRDGLVDAVEDWIKSGDPMRTAAAVAIAKDLKLSELTDELVQLLAQVIADSTPMSNVYGSNAVLRDRWKSRFRAQLRGALSLMTAEEKVPHGQGGGTQ